MFNIVDLFAGSGGLSLGFEMVKDNRGMKVFNLLKAIEIDPWACETLRKNFSKDAVIEGDLRKEETRKLIENTCKGKTDIVVGGPPCQSFSFIGPRSGNGIKENMYKYDGLYGEFIDIVRRLSPKFVVFENVKGILSKNNGDRKIIDVILSKLQSLGYKCGNGNGFLVLNAADYGVPQVRERVFIIGHNIRAEEIIPKKTHYNPKKNKDVVKGLLPYVTLQDAIGDLPKLRAKKTFTRIPKRRRDEIERYNTNTYSGNDVIEYKAEWSKRHRKKIDIAGKQFFRFVRPSDDIPLTHHTARQQMETDIKLFEGMKQGMTAKNVIGSDDPRIGKLSKYIRYDMKSFKDKYKKQHWKMPCSTIFAHLQKDGNRFIHPDSHQARTLTPREAARIQSFPDCFYFEGSFTKKFQQIGNAVPPLLVKKIAESLANALNVEKIISKESYDINERKNRSF